MKKSLLVAGPLLAAVLVGCSGGQTTAGPTAASSAPAAADASGDVLARNGLGGLSVEQVIEKLDAATDDRQDGPMGSVRPTELVLTEKSGTKTSLPITNGRFYLAMAPYLSQTHECFNHNLATCQGELVNQPIHVTLVDDKGVTVLDKDMVTMANGFASTWVPRGIKGTLTITHDQKKVTLPVSTGDQDPTCLSEHLRLQ